MICLDLIPARKPCYILKSYFETHLCNDITLIEVKRTLLLDRGKFLHDFPFI